MPDDLSFLDQLEEWLQAQVPSDLHDLPLRMLETMERVSNELFETLNINGPSSISIPFPPFLTKEPPPPPPAPRFLYALQYKAERLVRAHPYVVGAGAALALSLGIGAGLRVYKRGGMRLSVNGFNENGMLKEAIVILAPSPLPPITWALAITLLKAGYIVIIAVPDVEDAESLEKRLAPLEQKSALRVLIYDPNDPKTFPTFQRSLHATLTLRFPSSSTQTTNISDSYNPLPTQVPHIHSYISLYPLNPTPPSQPSPLPALPTLLEPNSSNGHSPKLITLYPSSSVLVQPNSFASQILTANHQLLARNLQIANSVKTISVYLGHLQLPTTASLLSDTKARKTVQPRFIDVFRSSTGINKLYTLKDYFLGGIKGSFSVAIGRLGLGTSAQKYERFEHQFLRLLRTRRQRSYLGQYSKLPIILSRLSAPLLNFMLPYLPNLPSPSGPGVYTPTIKGVREASRDGNVNVEVLNEKRGNASRDSASSSDVGDGDVEGEEGLFGSIHTSSGESGSGEGLEGSWIGLERA